MFRVKGISKNYGDLKVLDQLDLEFPENRITMILGPSGCGKTTLLNMMAGLIKPDAGSLEVPEEVSYLFQEPRLLPWLTVAENLRLVLEGRGTFQEIEERITRFLTAAQVSQYAGYYPAQLSGGLRQRAALARAFAFPAFFLLMDEPFKSLDIKIRYKLLTDFIRMWRQEPRTVVAVTHDVREAVELGDKVILLSDKPTGIRKQFEIELPQEKRRGSQEIIKLEQEIVKLIV